MTLSRSRPAGIGRRNLLLASALPLFVRAAWSGDYPNRPIRFLTMLSPGGDVLVRLVADQVGTTIGQPVFVENKLGGAGLIGATAGATAAPDGYTVLFALGSTMTITTNMVAEVPFDTLRDVIPLVLIASNPLVLLVNPQATPIGSAKDFIANCRDRPGTVSFSSYGTGSMPHILTSLLAKQNQVQMNAVTYRSNGEAYADLLAGRLTIMLDQVTNALPYVDANRLKALAVTGNNAPCPATRRADADRARPDEFPRLELDRRLCACDYGARRRAAVGKRDRTCSRFAEREPEDRGAGS